MLTVISPAKTLDFDTPTVTDAFTQPVHLTQSRKLVQRMRQLSGQELEKLMHVSGNIADLNQQRFKKWKTPFNPENARQAIFAFKGDVYIGLDAYSMTARNVEFAQDHLRILSGLYGVLRPLDLMQPYRLEMGTRIDTDTGKNLYQFWDGRITKTLNQELEQSGANSLINLASNEYFKSIKPRLVNGRIITPQFKEAKSGGYRMIGVYAKRARGLMSRFIIENRLSDPESIKGFAMDGYRYNGALSQGEKWVFTRG